MKIIKYKFLSAEVNHGTEEEPNIEQILIDVTMTWNETNEKVAKHEAYNGEYEIIDDGQPEPITTTTEERVEALEAAVTMLCMPDVSEV
jgi:hypothetical protein